ncbi:MAG: hypothetical protein ACK5JM_13210 [Rhodoblastus sp.]
MRIRMLASLLFLLSLGACARVDEARAPDPASFGGGIAGSTPGGSPYQK